MSIQTSPISLQYVLIPSQPSLMDMLRDPRSPLSLSIYPRQHACALLGCGHVHEVRTLVPVCPSKTEPSSEVGYTTHSASHRPCFHPANTRNNFHMLHTSSTSTSQFADRICIRKQGISFAPGLASLHQRTFVSGILVSQMARYKSRTRVFKEDGCSVPQLSPAKLRRGQEVRVQHQSRFWLGVYVASGRLRERLTIT